jgi:hypothetical protein
MGSWILLLLTQASLVATKHGAIHKKLGLASIVLAPAMVVTGFVLVPSNFAIVWALNPEIVPAQVIADTKVFISNIALIQIRVGILFAIMVGLAFYYRKIDSGTHKRLMILATVLPIPAALDRITWLPNTMPGSPLAPDLYVLLLIFPMLAYDLAKRNGIPKAYAIWITGFLPTSIIVNLLWSSTWWLSTAPRIMGM